MLVIKVGMAEYVIVLGCFLVCMDFIMLFD
jgi:hypothetical protein